MFSSGLLDKMLASMLCAVDFPNVFAAEQYPLRASFPEVRDSVEASSGPNRSRYDPHWRRNHDRSVHVFRTAPFSRNEHSSPDKSPTLDPVRRQDIRNLSRAVRSLTSLVAEPARESPVATAVTVPQNSALQTKSLPPGLACYECGVPIS